VKRPHKRGLKVRIIVKAMLGWRVKDISNLLDCNDEYAYRVLADWRADEGLKTL
jgi:hypothetical protein